MNFQDLESGVLVRKRELDLPVQSSRTQEGRVENIRSVCGSDDFNVDITRKTVQLIGVMRFVLPG